MSPLRKLLNLDADVLEIQQVLFFFMLGAWILVSRGNVLSGPVYSCGDGCSSAWYVGLLLVVCALGQGYAYLIGPLWVRRIWLSIAALFWATLVGFYYNNSSHQIGAATCGVLFLGQAWGFFRLTLFSHIHERASDRRATEHFSDLLYRSNRVAGASVARGLTFQEIRTRDSGASGIAERAAAYSVRPTRRLETERRGNRSPETRDMETARSTTDLIFTS